MEKVTDIRDGDSRSHGDAGEGHNRPYNAGDHETAHDASTREEEP
jgi:hypothetical protein